VAKIDTWTTEDRRGCEVGVVRAESRCPSLPAGVGALAYPPRVR
jgi:hypothetical protein